jgi:hypothetical protein
MIDYFIRSKIVDFNKKNENFFKNENLDLPVEYNRTFANNKLYMFQGAGKRYRPQIVEWYNNAMDNSKMSDKNLNELFRESSMIMNDKLTFIRDCYKCDSLFINSG